MKNIHLTIHKIRHWEYWPYQILYIPAYLQYIYYVTRTGSFFYFNASNPSFKNGGFFMGSKKEIYDLIPQQYYPKTLLLQVKENTNIDIVQSKIKEAGITFPLIAKPNIGLRGTAVKKIDTILDLKNYIQNADFDFLIQELIPYKNEIGLFYVKLPKQEKGFITGIVSKEFLNVEGNGIHTIRELLKKDPRFELQIPALEKEIRDRMDIVLKDNEKINLVPYGNHCRGTKFIDTSSHITPKITTLFNHVCSQIKGFYFGRLDIMYNSFDDLEQGKNFQIVEINGAISEPSHMYDPKHHLIYAWKEIIRHFHYMYLISEENHKKGTKYLTFKEGVEAFKSNRKHYKSILKF